MNPVSPVSSVSDDTHPAFDAEELSRWYDNDLEAIHELVGLVQRDLPRYVQTLEGAADSGDLPAVARAAHTIKGAVGNVCALRLCGVTEAVEQAARQGDLSRVAMLRPDFRQSVTELLSALDVWTRNHAPSAALGDGQR